MPKFEKNVCMPTIGERMVVVGRFEGLGVGQISLHSVDLNLIFNFFVW